VPVVSVFLHEILDGCASEMYRARHPTSRLTSPLRDRRRDPLAADDDGADERLDRDTVVTCLAFEDLEQAGGSSTRTSGHGTFMAHSHGTSAAGRPPAVRPCV